MSMVSAHLHVFVFYKKAMQIKNQGNILIVY